MKQNISNSTIKTWLESFAVGDYSTAVKEIAAAALARFYSSRSEGGKKSSANLTAEQRSERAHKAAQARRKK